MDATTDELVTIIGEQTIALRLQRAEMGEVTKIVSGLQNDISLKDNEIDGLKYQVEELTRELEKKQRRAKRSGKHA